MGVLGEAYGNRRLWPGTIVTICVSYFTTGSPGKEHGTRPPATGRARERSKGDTTCPGPPTSSSLASILAEQRMPHQSQPGNESHHHRSRACGATWRGGSGSPGPAALRLAPCPGTSLALSACVSRPTIHFRVVDRAHSRALEGVPLPAPGVEETARHRCQTFPGCQVSHAGECPCRGTDDVPGSTHRGTSGRSAASATYSETAHQKANTDRQAPVSL